MLRNVVAREKFTFRTSSRRLAKATKTSGKHNFDDPSCLSEPESSVEHPGTSKFVMSMMVKSWNLGGADSKHELSKK